MEMADLGAFTDREGDVESGGGAGKGRRTERLEPWGEGGRMWRAQSPRLAGPKGSFPRDRRSC